MKMRILLICLLFSVYFCLKEVKIRCKDRDRIAFTPKGNTLYSIESMGTACSIYVAANDPNIQNCIIRLNINQISQTPYLQIDSHPISNMTMEIILPVEETIYRHKLTNSIIGDSTTLFRVSELKIRVSFVSHWFIKSKSAINVELTDIPIGTDAIFDLYPGSVMNIENFYQHLVVVNATVNFNPKISKLDKKLYVVGPSAVLNGDFTQFPVIHYFDGCAKTLVNNPPNNENIWMLSNFQFFNVNYKKAIQNCSIYTNNIAKFDMKAHVLYSSELSSYNNTKWLALRDGYLHYDQMFPIHSSKLTTRSFLINNDSLITVTPSYTSHLNVLFTKSSEMMVDCDNMTKNFWNFNSNGNERILHWNTVFCEVSLNSQDGKIPSIHATHKEEMFLQMNMKLLQTPNRNNRNLIWDSKEMKIYNNEEFIFSFDYEGITNIHLNFTDVLFWKTHVISKESFEQRFWIFNSMNNSDTAIVSIDHFGNSTESALNENEILFSKFSLQLVGIRQVIYNFKIASFVKINDVPHYSEFICLDCASSIVLIHRMNNFMLLTMNKGCLDRNSSFKSPSNWFLRNLKDLRIDFKMKQLKCHLQIFSIENLFLNTPVLHGMDINIKKDVQILHLHGNLDYIENKECVSALVENQYLKILGETQIKLVRESTANVKLKFCKQNQFYLKPNEGNSKITFNFNCINETTDAPLLSSVSPSEEVHLCNPFSIPPFINIDTNLNSLILKVDPKTVSTENHTLNIGLNEVNVQNITTIVTTLNQTNQLFVEINVRETIIVPSSNLRELKNKPIIKVTKFSNVNMAMDENATVSFSSILNWDKHHSIFGLKDTNHYSCLNPTIQCTPNSLIDANIFGNMCLHPKLQEQCQRNKLLHFQFENSKCLCNVMNNRTELLFQQNFNLNETKFFLEMIPFEVLHYIYTIGKLFISSIYPIGYIFDFGFSSLIIGGVLETESPNPNDWNPISRIIVTFSRSLTFGSPCSDSSWNYISIAMISTFLILQSLLIFILNLKFKRFHELISRISILGSSFKERKYGLFLEIGFMSLTFFVLTRVPQMFKGILFRSIFSTLILLIIFLSMIVYVAVHYIKKLPPSNLMFGIFMFSNFLFIFIASFVSVLFSINQLAFSISFLVLFNIFKFIQLIMIIQFTKRSCFKFIFIPIILVFDVVSIVFGSLYIHHRFNTDFGYFVPFWIGAFFSGIFRFLLILISPKIELVNVINDDPLDELQIKIEKAKLEAKKRRLESQNENYNPLLKTQEELDSMKQNLIINYGTNE
jgi:hypothetical protein